MVMLGTRVYTDEYGSPYIRVRTWDFENPAHLFWSGYRSGDPAAGFVEYVPKFPPDPNYDAWPEALRRVIPYEWSGDYTRGGWTSAQRGARTGNPAFPGYDEYQDPRNVAAGVIEGQTAMYTLLRTCGWGRWVGMPSTITGKPGPPCIMRTGIDIGAALESAGDMFRHVGGQLGAALRAIAKLVSFIPGIGTVAAAVLAGIGSLAAGEPLDSAILDAVVNAIPGGGIAKDAAKTGVAMARKLIEGGNIGDAALAGVRTMLEQQGLPVQALTAFDVGVALGTGAGLQSAGFKVLNLFAPGNDLIERGANYTKAIARAASTGKPLQEVLTQALGGELAKIENAAAQLGPVIVALDSDPAKIAMGSYELAEQLGVPEPVARAGQVIMRDGIEDDEMRRRLLMTATERAFEKYGAQVAVGDDFAPKWTDSYLSQQIAKQVGEDDSLKWAAQKAGQDAQLVRAATSDFRTSFIYQYQQATGVDLVAQREIAKRAAADVPAVTASASPRAETKSTVGQDIGLGLTVAAALGALYLWTRE